MNVHCVPELTKRKKNGRKDKIRKTILMVEECEVNKHEMVCLEISFILISIFHNLCSLASHGFEQHK